MKNSIAITVAILSLFSFNANAAGVRDTTDAGSLILMVIAIAAIAFFLLKK